MYCTVATDTKRYACQPPAEKERYLSTDPGIRDLCTDREGVIPLHVPWASGIKDLLMLGVEVDSHQPPTAKVRILSTDLGIQGFVNG